MVEPQPPDRSPSTAAGSDLPHDSAATQREPDQASSTRPVSADDTSLSQSTIAATPAGPPSARSSSSTSESTANSESIELERFLLALGRSQLAAGYAVDDVTNTLDRVARAYGRRDLSVAVFPGGYGTLDELFEQLTWRVIGKHKKPIGLLDVIVDGVSYWQPLLTFLDHAVDVGFIRKEARALCVVHTDIDALCEHLHVKR